ncbi:putative peptidoglycan muropeptide transporter SLC46 isoform X2 [Xylocopa sonorina]|uniref:putative peptidoglycan muropeptide transporter SLC46 isoform X2 n=1 Tax=Xylocopa sonorina TaxID=1818115 RepID=UPI00403B0242
MKVGTIGNILTDLIVYRTCSITLGINQTECLLLHETNSSAEALKVDKQVQPKASLILMTKSIIESIVPALLSLFLGPWSDIYGRKPIMLSGYIGLSLLYLIISFMTVWDVSPWFLLIAYIPYACLGGFSIVLLGTICYISDITSEQERSWQLAWMDALISVGYLIGILVGPEIFQAYGYTVVFATATICCMLAGLYICFLVPKTTYNTDSVTIKCLFDVRLVRQLIDTCIKKRDGFDRYIVWCCTAIIILKVLLMEGEMTVGFMFVNARLGWDVNKYSIYMAANVIISIFGLIFGMKLLVTYAGFTEETSAIISSFSSLCGSLVQSFTYKSWHMYLSAVVQMFGGITSPLIRAILSKSVPSDDTGKVFSMTISIETLVPFIGASLYSMIYSYSMPPTYPLPVWLLSVGISIAIIIILINLLIRHVKSNSVRHTPLIENDELSS